MNVEQIEVSRVIPYARNARTHSKEQVDQLAHSIRNFGFNNPILIDPRNEIIAGHGRVLAAQQCGMKSVPAIRLDHLNDAQRRAFIIADNRITMNSGWDEDTLRLELEQIQADGSDLSSLGFSTEELEHFELLDDIEVEKFGAAKEDDGTLTAKDYAKIGKRSFWTSQVVPMIEHGMR